MSGTDANGFVQVLCVDSTKYALLMNYSTTNKHNVSVLKLDLSDFVPNTENGRQCHNSVPTFRV